jgi:hypothetical protein
VLGEARDQVHGRLRIISDQAPGAIPRSGFVLGRRADLDTARHHAPMEHSVSTALRDVATILSPSLRKAAHTIARGGSQLLRRLRDVLTPTTGGAIRRARMRICNLSLNSR